MKHSHGFLTVTSSDTGTAGSGKARHRRGQWGRKAFRATAIAAVAAVISTGAIAAVAAPADSSNASARFLSGTLLTSAGTLDSLAALQGSTATNSGSPTADTQTSSLDLSAVGGALTVDIPGGVTIPLSQFLQLGLVNQYAQASDNGVSRAASGAVSDGGIVDLSGTGAFPADAQIDLVNLLGAPANGVLDTANVQLGAVTGVAALDAAQAGGPATSCADLSNPTNCRDYNIANATLNLHSPLVSTAVGSINTTLDATSTTVNGLSSTLTNSVTGIVGGVLGGLGGFSDLNVSVTADLRTALSSVLSGSVSEGGVTLDLADGTITVDLGAVIGSLNNQNPNTPLLSATVINAVVADLGTILTTLQTNINTALQTALNSVPVVISGGICLPTGCDPGALGLGGKLSLSYNGTLGDLVAGTDAIVPTGTGAVFALLAPVIGTLSGTISAALGLLITPVLTSAISTVGAAVTAAALPLVTQLTPVLSSISSVIGITLNVQEPGTASGSYREVAARVSLLSGAGATVDLGRAEVGPNVVGAAVAPTITSLTPTHGPEAGGTVVTITGTGFTGATGVTFDGTPGTAFTVDSDTQITVTTPANAPGAADVVVQSPNGNSAPGTFTFDPAASAPTITSLSPDHGPEAGGTVVTVTGTGFTGATGVTFDGTAGTAFTVDSDTQITVTTPAHAPGATDVVVQSPNGDSAPGTFTFDAAPAAPSITSLSPDHGPEAGGTVVTVTGTGFTGATGVTFDGTAGTAFTVDNDTQITVTSPAHAPGATDVVVRSPNGDSAPGTFTFDAAPAAPTITALAPDHGPVTGGTAVTITGTGFTGATGVTFDGTAGTAFTVDSDTQITVTSPAHPVGPVDVVVQSPNGASAPGTFTYNPVTTIIGVNPSSGPEAGGTPVLITGACFTGATAVTFGGVAATSFLVIDDSTISAVTPAGTGVVDVSVTGGGDCGTGTLPGGFAYVPAPAITGLNPDHGPVAGGTVVTITGTGFTAADGVTFDGISGTSFTVDSDTQITVTTPAHPAGPVDVVVESPNGNSAPGTFTFDAAPAAPSITALAPDHGPVTGGTAVTITGTGFTGATGVTFDGTAGTAFTVDSDTQITVTSPAHPVGPVDVVVQSPNGASAPGTFTYNPVTVVSGVTPNSGPEAGGTPVVITGACFTGATAVTFGGVAATAFLVIDDSTISAITPAGTGVVDVSVIGVGDCGTGTLPGGFTYVAAPVISGLNPDHGPAAGGTSVTITGTGFSGATSVTFDGAPATAYTVDSDTQITATTPAHVSGPVDVVVTTVVGSSAPLTYTYDPVTTIDGVDPGTGPEVGGNTVTITGHCFTGATSVLFGTTPATSFTVVSDTEITAVAPAGVGTVDVTVVGAGSCGTGTDPGGYEYVPTPVIQSLTPTSGPETGGTVVTVTGTGFADATGVTFDGTAGTAFTVVSDTEITVTTPAHAVGPVDVVVTDPVRNSDPGTFTYLAVPPVITSIAPDNGPETGGTVVTVTGTGFTGATGVTFDGTAGTSFTIVSDTQITVTTPAHAPGTVDVTVTSPNGDSTAGEFTYTPVTAIESVTPNVGPEAGGTSVVITGVCFTGATGVLFGTTPATSFTVNSDSTITAVAPAGVGTVDVTVLGSQSCGNATDPGAYTYLPDTTPIITGLTPVRGPEAGGTVVTITGQNFTDATGVTFDGKAGTSFRVDSDTQITVTTPPHAAATVEVLVSAGQVASNAGAFTYFAVADIGGVDPGTGPTDGGTTVTITGKCFTGATGVLFGKTPAKSFTVVNDTTIRAVTPAGTGKVDVTVVGGGDCGSATLPNGFEYVTAAAVLARTGVDVLAGTWMSAFALMLAGLVLVAIRRRRSAE